MLIVLGGKALRALAGGARHSENAPDITVAVVQIMD
jgi:hypothetical protein